MKIFFAVLFTAAGTALAANAQEWLDGGYGCRIPLKLEASAAAGDLRDFPVCVRLHDAELFRKIRPDGSDLRFTARDGKTLLPHETNDFDMFEFDPSELAFQIMFFAGFDDAPVKMKIVADRVNCHFRAKFEDRSLQCLRNSGFWMGQKRQFFHRKALTTRTIYTVKFHLKINFHASIGQSLNTSCPVMMRIDRTMKTFGTAKFLPFQTLNHFSFRILKRMVLKSNNSLCMVCKTGRHYVPPCLVSKLKHRA